MLGDSQDASVSDAEVVIDQVPSPVGQSDAHHVSIYMEEVQISQESVELTPKKQISPIRAPSGSPHREHNSPLQYT